MKFIFNFAKSVFYCYVTIIKIRRLLYFRHFYDYDSFVKDLI